ncbi:MAG: substrate-binding domain-containing protein [Hungatella sp.]|jgi:simple sugar transport system substrate-binding protein|nr:substrate-binding domain-containing protein [Hungatella sp.]
MRKVLSMLLAGAMALSLTACGSGQGQTQNGTQAPSTSQETAKAAGSQNTKPADGDFASQGYRIAYILNVASSDIFQMAVSEAKATAEAMGMTVDVYFTDTDNVKFQDYVNTCAGQDYDAMFLSHGNQETAYDLVNMLVGKGIKVVCFDTQLIDTNGEKTSIEGVTQMFQNDQMMADLLLDYICDTLYPDKVAAKEPVKILKIWRGPGISPFDRRQETYKAYEDKGLITTVETLGPIDPANGEASMAQVVASALPKYPAGAVDAIWGCYDAYSRGVYVALMEAGRTDIPLVSVDISNQDINYMIDGNNVWQACSAVDFSTIGQQGIRILAMKLHGDETESVYNLTPSLVLYDQLDQNSNVLNLKDTIDGYGVNDDHIPEWMAPYLGK